MSVCAASTGHPVIIARALSLTPPQKTACDKNAEDEDEAVGHDCEQDRVDGVQDEVDAPCGLLLVAGHAAGGRFGDVTEQRLPDGQHTAGEDDGEENAFSIVFREKSLLEQRSAHACKEKGWRANWEHGAQLTTLSISFLPIVRNATFSLKPKNKFILVKKRYTKQRKKGNKTKKNKKGNKVTESRRW